MNDIEIDPEITYTVKLTEKTSPSFKITKPISEWLVSNLAGLTDDNNHEIFNKVNTGYNEESLKTFTGKPVCDVYVNHVEYSPNFDYKEPDVVNSIVIFYLKGANNNSYMKASEIHDYLMQKFINDESFQRLPGVVRDTYITDSRLMVEKIKKRWGVMGAFELSHKL